MNPGVSQDPENGSHFGEDLILSEKSLETWELPLCLFLIYFKLCVGVYTAFYCKILEIAFGRMMVMNYTNLALRFKQLSGIYQRHSIHHQNKVAMKERQETLSCYSCGPGTNCLYLGQCSDLVTQNDHGESTMKLPI